MILKNDAPEFWSVQDEASRMAGDALSLMRLAADRGIDGGGYSLEAFQRFIEDGAARYDLLSELHSLCSDQIASNPRLQASYVAWAVTHPRMSREIRMLISLHLFDFMVQLRIEPGLWEYASRT